MKILIACEYSNTLDKLSKEEGRSRKNFCETEIRKLIEASKLKTGSNNA